MLNNGDSLNVNNNGQSFNTTINDGGIENVEHQGGLSRFANIMSGRIETLAVIPTSELFRTTAPNMF